MAARSSGVHGRTEQRRNGEPGVWGKCSPELAEHDGLVGEGGEASTAANRRRRARGSGESSVKLASRLDQIEACPSVIRWSRGRRAHWTSWLELWLTAAASSGDDELRGARCRWEEQ